MTDYEAFLSRVLPSVPGCPDIAAVLAIRDATIQLCKDSLINQTDQNPISTVAFQADYDLETPDQILFSQERVFKIMTVWFKGTKLTPIAPDEVRDPSAYNQDIGGYTTTYGTPSAYTVKQPLQFTLIPVPATSIADCVTMRVAIVPTRTSTTCQDFLFEDWAEHIASGAIARLLTVPGKAYTNFALAPAHQARFQAGINFARQQANRGRVRSDLSVQMRRI